MRFFSFTLSGLLPLTLAVTAACSGPIGSPSAASTGAGPDAGPQLAHSAGRRPHTDLALLPAFLPGIDGYDPEPLCPTVISLGAGERLASSTSGQDFGLSVTPDELSAAWMTETQGVVTLHYVDRARSTDAFGARRTVTGAFAVGRVALSADGLDLAVVDADGLGFSVLRREARAEAFGAPEVGPFELLDEAGRDVLAPLGERYADPLFANADGYFIFSRITADGTGTVHLGSRFFSRDPFSPGVPFAEEALAPIGAKRRSVTGASADVRTLFVWDEAAAVSQVVRLSARGVVESTTLLGAARDVQPTADCRVLWFTSGSPADVRRSTVP
jgi:hypothetical protein